MEDDSFYGGFYSFISSLFRVSASWSAAATAAAMVTQGKTLDRILAVRYLALANVPFNKCCSTYALLSCFQISANNSTPPRYSKKTPKSGIIWGQILGRIRGDNSI